MQGRKSCEAVPRFSTGNHLLLLGRQGTFCVGYDALHDSTHASIEREGSRAMPGPREQDAPPPACHCCALQAPVSCPSPNPPSPGPCFLPTSPCVSANKILAKESTRAPPRTPVESNDHPSFFEEPQFPFSTITSDLHMAPAVYSAL